jgi:hypothetical protein
MGKIFDEPKHPVIEKTPEFSSIGRTTLNYNFTPITRDEHLDVFVTSLPQPLCSHKLQP